MECIGAIDQGTQSTRFTLFNKDLEIISCAQKEISAKYPYNGWCEQDPVEILESIHWCIKKCKKELENKSKDSKVVCIGITNQRETTVLWDKNSGRPLYNAISWQDTRTKSICTELTKKLNGKKYFHSITGLPISTYFSAVKILWLKENVMEVKYAIKEKRCCFGTIDSWIVYNLTGAVNGGHHVTDVTNASRTMLMDLSLLDWHKPLLRILDLQNIYFPEIKSNSENFGIISEGLLEGVPITGMIGDQHAATLGHCCKVGEAKCTYGTGCFILLNTGRKKVYSSYGLLTTIVVKSGIHESTYYALEGSVASAGSLLTWLKNNLSIIDEVTDISNILKDINDSEGVYFIPAISGLLAPYWREDVKGVIYGLSTYSRREHIILAAFEAICYQTFEIIEAMEADSKITNIKLLKVDGGVSKNDFLLQIQSNLLQKPLIRPLNIETTSLGASIAAGIALKMFRWKQLYKTENDIEIYPKISYEIARLKIKNWKKIVKQTLNFKMPESFDISL